MKTRAKIILLIVTLIAATVAFFVAPLAYHAGEHLFQSFRIQLDVSKVSTLIIALCALLIAWNNFRRGNTAIVKLVDVTASGQTTVGVNDDKVYYVLQFFLKNVGIPLRKPSVSINGSAGGWLHIPIWRYKAEKRIERDDDSVLEKGMLANYAIYSTSLNAVGLEMLKTLIEPESKNICLSVWSDGYIFGAIAPFRRLEIFGTALLSFLKWSFR